MICHVDFDWTITVAHELAYDLMVKVEAIALEPQSINAVATEDLVHSERIPQLLLEYRVEQPSEKKVPDIHQI